MISVKRDDKGSGRLGEGGRAAQGRKRKGGSQHKLWKVGISQSEWVLGSGQAGKVEPGGKKIRSVVCVATVPSTMASPGPNKYLRKEGSKEGKKQGREEERAERKVANPSLLSPGFRSGCGGMCRVGTHNLLKRKRKAEAWDSSCQVLMTHLSSYPSPNPGGHREPQPR